MDGATWAVLSKTKNCSFLRQTMDYNWTVPYIVQDDFLDKQDLEYVNSIADRMIKDLSLDNDLISEKIEESWQSHNIIKPNQEPHITAPGIELLYEKYKHKFEEFLAQLNPTDSTDTYHSINIIVTEPNNEYSAHVDSNSKMLSCVVYASEKNIGTRLYSTQDKQDPYEVEWKQNRIFVFSRNENSWHDWASSDQYRVALVWNIILDV